MALYTYERKSRRESGGVRSHQKRRNPLVNKLLLEEGNGGLPVEDSSAKDCNASLLRVPNILSSYMELLGVSGLAFSRSKPANQLQPPPKVCSYSMANKPLYLFVAVV